MGLPFGELARRAKPGQFVMVRLPDRRIPLLRRPFSIHRRLIKKGEVSGFELLYKVVGQGTEALSKMKVGDVLDVLGPLGNGYSYPQNIRNMFLVAGGIGVASLYYLAVDLAEHRAARLTVFIGGCSASDILCREGFESIGAKVRIATEDGSLGERGVVTSLVREELDLGATSDMICACGPQGMLEAVGDIAAAHNVSCQISLESTMACGFGVCLGCAVEKAGSPGTYFHACTDGPVFDSRCVKY